jgi:hypothetical protein
MTRTLRQILAAGVSLRVTGNDRIKAEGPLTDVLRELIRANKLALVEELTSTPHYRWRVGYTDGRRLEVAVLPELNHRDMLDRYPGATIEPLPENVH